MAVVPVMQVVRLTAIRLPIWSMDVRIGGNHRHSVVECSTTKSTSLSIWNRSSTLPTSGSRWPIVQNQVLGFWRGPPTMEKLSNLGSILPKITPNAWEDLEWKPSHLSRRISPSSVVPIFPAYSHWIMPKLLSTSSRTVPLVTLLQHPKNCKTSLVLPMCESVCWEQELFKDILWT